MLKRYTTIFWIATSVVLIATTIPVCGRTLVGFRYRAVSNNAFTVCPDHVTRHSGDTITLSNGEQYKVTGVSAVQLTEALARSESFVKVNREHRYLSIRRRRDICGMRPEMNQWITIPLWAAERIETHCAVEFADVEPLPTASQK